MSEHTALPKAAEPSPKVLWPLLVGILLTGLAALLATVTPDTLQAFGPWAIPASTGLVASGGYIAGYLKRDPLRDLGADTAKQAAIEAGSFLPPATR